MRAIPHTFPLGDYLAGALQEGVPLLQGSQRRHLGEPVGGEGGEHFADLLAGMFGAQHVAHPQAGQSVGFGEGAENNHVGGTAG